MDRLSTLKTTVWSTRISNGLKILIFVSALLYACDTHIQFKSYQHTRQFGDTIVNKFNPKNLKQTSLDLGEIFRSDWDSLIIVPAYVETKQFDYIQLNNLGNVKQALDQVRYRDDLTTILLIKNASIIACERVFNRPVNLSSIIHTFDEGDIPVIRRSKRGHIVLKQLLPDYPGEYVIEWKN